MIAFNCSTCGKPFIVPNKAGSKPWICPVCGGEHILPAPRKPRKERSLLLFVAGLAVITGIAIWLWPTSAKRAALVRDRLTVELGQLSPQWKGVDWKVCDPEKGEYRLDAFYATPKGTYTLTLNRSLATDYSSVKIDPKANSWLALTLFFQGEFETFEYRGKDPTEKEQLRSLSFDLDSALTQSLQ
jgi:hypothetical protein